MDTNQENSRLPTEAEAMSDSLTTEYQSSTSIAR